MNFLPENLYRPTDDAARGLAHQILANARHAALGTLHPDCPPTSLMPVVTRVAVAPAGRGAVVMLVSALSLHSRAMRRNGAVSVLLGDVTAKGDALTQPRLTLVGTARFFDGDAADHAHLRKLWLKHQPKAAVYVDLPDFSFVTVEPVQAFLNAGFGRAYLFEQIDLT